MPRCAFHLVFLPLKLFMPKLFKSLSFVLLFILVSFVSVPLQATARSLGVGSHGGDVLQLQKRLQQQGYLSKKLKLTGYFGLATRKAVMAFQKANHLPAVGKVGPVTGAVLAKIFNPIRSKAVTISDNTMAPAVQHVVNNPIITTPQPALPVSQPAITVSQIVPPTPPVVPAAVSKPEPTIPAPLPPSAAPSPAVSPVVQPEPTTAPAPVIISSKTKAALPLYIYPSPDEKNWQTAIDANDQVDFIIANVNNGPSTVVKANWTAMIQKTVAAGEKVYGYVYTNYGKRDSAAVDADIALWLKFYPHISGIFFDEVAAGADKLPYYTARYEYVKNLDQKLQVVINPGTNTDEGYMAVSDVNIIFESGYGAWSGKQIPAWVKKYAPERFYAIVYNVPTEVEMKQVVATAKARNFGKMFVTSAAGPSGALPAYFQSELVEIAK